MFSRQFRPGDCVVYRKPKHTTHPGRRAKEVRAARKGDNYTYFVDKFWVVRSVLPSGELVVETRRGKTHLIDQSDPKLSHPTLLRRMWNRTRFADIHRADSAS